MNFARLFEASSYAGWGLIANALHSVLSGGAWQAQIAPVLMGVAAILKSETGAGA